VNGEFVGVRGLSTATNSTPESMSVAMKTRLRDRMFLDPAETEGNNIARKHLQ
jgi:hypothetical protein